MPKKSRKKRQRKTPTSRSAQRKPSRPTTASESLSIWERMRRNWAATGLVILGLLVAASMIIALVAPILTPATSAPTPTPSGGTAAPGPDVETPVPTTSASTSPSPTKQAKVYVAPPPMTIDPTGAYTATVETIKGTFVIQLLPDVAPQTVNNFVFLAREGFYDGLVFHRVEPWVVQGGDPLGTGGGGPGYTIPAEFESSRTYSQVRGIVGMARAQDPNSGGSQWYVIKQDATSLDGQYTTFGRVVAGMDVVDELVVGDMMTRITIAESK